MKMEKKQSDMEDLKAVVQTVKDIKKPPKTKHKVRVISLGTDRGARRQDCFIG